MSASQGGLISEREDNIKGTAPDQPERRNKQGSDEKQSQAHLAGTLSGIEGQPSRHGVKAQRLGSNRQEAGCRFPMEQSASHQRHAMAGGAFSLKDLAYGWISHSQPSLWKAIGSSFTLSELKVP